jgi:hypothetical protein
MRSRWIAVLSTSYNVGITLSQLVFTNFLESSIIKQKNIFSKTNLYLDRQRKRN